MYLSFLCDWLKLFQFWIFRRIGVESISSYKVNLNLKFKPWEPSYLLGQLIYMSMHLLCWTNYHIIWSGINTTEKSVLSMFKVAGRWFFFILTYEVLILGFTFRKTTHLVRTASRQVESHWPTHQIRQNVSKAFDKPPLFVSCWPCSWPYMLTLGLIELCFVGWKWCCSRELPVGIYRAW